MQLSGMDTVRLRRESCHRDMYRNRTYQYSYTNAYRGTDRHSDPDTDAHAYSHSHLNADSDSDTNRLIFIKLVGLNTGICFDIDPRFVL